MTSPAVVSLEDLSQEACALLDSMQATEDGLKLDEPSAALIGLAVRASVAALDVSGIREYAERALDAGATPDQVHETLVLVSGLGVHSLMVGSREVASVLRERGQTEMTDPLDEHRRALWRENVGTQRLWQRMEEEVPGFLDALLRLSPETFQAFFAYLAVPWRTAAIPPVIKELMAMATDATPTHRYVPGLRLHLANSVRLGAGRADVLGALAIAAAAPNHEGIGAAPPVD